MLELSDDTLVVFVSDSHIGGIVVATDSSRRTSSRLFSWSLRAGTGPSS